MKNSSLIILFILINILNSFGQNSNNHKFGKLLINFPAQPETKEVDGNKMLECPTRKGKLWAMKTEVPKEKKLPPNDSLKEFYNQTIKERYSDWNIKSEEIYFFKIGEYNAVFFPYKDTPIGSGYMIQVLIDKQYYGIMYFIPKGDKSSFEYSRDEFIKLVNCE